MTEPTPSSPPAPGPLAAVRYLIADSRAAIAYARELGVPEDAVVLTTSPAPLLDPAADARPLAGPFFDRAVRLRLLQLLSAGYDSLPIEEARAARVPVAVNGGANAVSVAEHTILLVLAPLRQLPRFLDEVRRGVWKRAQLAAERIDELEGKRFGVGRVGRQLALRLRAFGVEIVYYDVVRPTAEEVASLAVSFLGLDEILATADVVSLHVPLTERTRGMIGRPQLATMKPTAILVNTARSGLVDELALAEALRDGTLLAAAIDTLEREPAPADHPLLGLPNCIVTPHIAGPSWDSWPKRFRNASENVERVERGDGPRWVIPEMSELGRERR